MKKKKSGIGGFFKEFGEAVVKGDLFVKLSLVWMGAGYIRRKQIIKGILMTLLEVAVIVFTFGFATEYVRDFGTLGTVQQETVFNIVTMQNEFNGLRQLVYDLVVLRSLIRDLARISGDLV